MDFDTNTHGAREQVFAFPIIWLTLSEFTTPFSNTRWLLQTLGHKDTRWYLYNGVGLTLSFFAFRVLVYGAGLVHFVRHLYPVLLASDKPFVSKYVNASSIVIGYGLNLWWFSKLVKGLYSLVAKKNKTKKQK